MKKVLSIILSLFMIFSLSACKEEKEISKHTVDVEYYANLGQIPECKYSLSTDSDTLKDELSAFAESEEGKESLYDVTEGKETVCITNGIYNFYYQKDKKDKNIDCIVSFEKAFDFEIGDIILSVKEALSGVEYTEEATNEENTFFMFAPIEGSVIKCEFENNTVMFVFENNALCATTIYKNDF